MEVLKTLSISKNHIREFSYDVIGASFKYKVNKHPQSDLMERGIKILAAVPESIADCWNILTDYDGKLPEYMNERTPEPHSTYWKHMCGLDLVE